MIMTMKKSCSRCDMHAMFLKEKGNFLVSSSYSECNFPFSTHFQYFHIEKNMMKRTKEWKKLKLFLLSFQMRRMKWWWFWHEKNWDFNIVANQIRDEIWGKENIFFVDFFHFQQLLIVQEMEEEKKKDKKSLKFHFLTRI